MTPSLITLTTDFGAGSPYVAAMKGVLLGLNPKLQLIDLSHRLPPQDLRATAFFLRITLPYYPLDALHVIVVDPGVGTERSLLYVELGGRRLLVPDNGCWTWLPELGQVTPVVRRLEASRYWRRQVSKTFHGRDILAPVAAHLSLGLDPALLGPQADTWVRLPWPEPECQADSIRGEVLSIDDFGNLITNIPEASLRSLTPPLRITAGGLEIPHCGSTYGNVPVGELIALVSSSGFLEIAVNQGSAAKRLRANPGMPVVVTGEGIQPAESGPGSAAPRN